MCSFPIGDHSNCVGIIQREQPFHYCARWGGYWYHYDTMHFEYRAELFLFKESPEQRTTDKPMRKLLTTTR
jgi:hypothetical protein